VGKRERPAKKHSGQCLETASREEMSDSRRETEKERERESEREREKERERERERE